MINSKSNKILRFMCENAGESTIKNIAKFLELTERSVRYELDKIDNYLEEINLKKLRRIFGGEIYFDDYKKFLELERIENNELDSEERKEYLTFLCIFNEKINLTKASKMLDVSRSTIRNDIKEIKEELLNENLEFKISQQEGLILTGVELNIRKQQLKFLLKNSNYIFYSNYNIKNRKESIMEDYINMIDIQTIKNFINYVQKLLNKIISDEAYNIIVLYILIAIIRIKQGKKIERVENRKFLEETLEYDVIQRSKGILEAYNDITLDENELLQITDYLLGSHTYNFAMSYYYNWIEIDVLVKKLINNFNKNIEIDISKDKILFDGLLNHMKPTIYRLKNNIKLENSILTEVLNSYSELFGETKKALKDIENYLGMNFSDDEIAFLTIYFKSAIDRNKQRVKKIKKVLIVCGHGYGTSSLLEQQLKESYTINITRKIPRYLLEKTLEEEEVDLVVSTVEISKELSIPIVKVNSILTPEDIKNLDKYSLLKQKRKYLLSSMLKLVENSCEIKNKNQLIKELNNYFEHRLINDLEEKEEQEYGLIDFLKEGNIILYDEINTWEEVIKITGKKLIENNSITEEYIDSMIENIHKFGSYVIITDKIAIPHAQNEKGVLKTDMCLLLLKKPILFPENKEVQIVLTFSSKDNKEHLSALAELIELINNKIFIEKLIKIKRKSDVLKLLKNTLKEK